ncbi:MAG: hypothetical protein GX811_03075, partial [Lentisphaerae bacterium]|nr:hypothetical protein [Lentisphaerota bacterium]
MTIGVDAQINCDTKGYSATTGPGTGSAGSHGGRGYGSDGPCYGSIIAPVDIGSRGRTGTSGGGAVCIKVAGSFIHNGLISADGGSTSWPTGAGGSIWITAGSISGSGTIRANAGTGTNNGTTNGGGGRVALILTDSNAVFSAFTGTVLATAGVGGSGAAGTIYFETSAHSPGKGELIINNINGSTRYGVLNTDLNGLEAVSYEFSRITLTNNAQLHVGSDDTLNIADTELGIDKSSKNAIWISGGTLLTPDVFSFSHMFMVVSAIESVFSPATSLTVGENAEFIVNQPHAMECSIIVSAGGKLTHTANPASQDENYKLVLSLQGNMLIENGASIDVTGRGFPVNYGPGSHPSVNSGASYGGLGVDGPACYGSLVAPTNLGSGGRSGGAGGGAICLNITGSLTNNGEIKANAASVTTRTGSGGSIYISAGQLIGTGLIEANSAPNVTGASPGGGGRVSLVVTNTGERLSSYAGLITAHGGRKSATISGGAGTIYLRDFDQGKHEGSLIIDNDGLKCVQTEISSDVVDTRVGNVFIQNGGHLLLNTNQTVTVNGNWSNSAGFSGLADSAVIFEGAPGSTSVIYGSTTFTGLLCTNGVGKTIQFQDACTNTIVAGGRLELTGSPTSTNMVMRSLNAGQAWFLKVDPLAAQLVSCVDVKDSDALLGVGAEILGINSKDRGNNKNWRFLQIYPGQVNTWTGGSNTTWSLHKNWDLDRGPLPTDVIVIPNNCENYPLLDAHQTTHEVIIQDQATLSLNGWNLIVTNKLTLAGHLIASDTESVILTKDADFTGASFTPAQSMLVLAGVDAQTINLDSVTFFKVLVENNLAPINILGGLIATELRCETLVGSTTIRFEPGKIIKLRDMVFSGNTGTPNIILRSLTAGQAWKLAVSGYRSVRGVDAQDSDASLG